jgi:hypothetical protein
MDTQEQPAAPDSNVSLDDRISAIMNGSPAEPEVKAPAIEEPEQQEAASDEVDAPQIPETFEFEMDGEKFVLPKKLEKSLMQERDYTQKTQDLAHKAKQIELRDEHARIQNFRAAFEHEVKDDVQQLAAYDAVLKQPVDWNSLSTDDKVTQLAQRTQWEKEREALRIGLREKHQQWAQKTDQALRELASKADEVVKQRVPNWNADAWKSVSEHAKQDGYTDIELGAINDPRHKLTLWKAQQFDQLKAKATKTVVDAKSVKTTPSNPMPQHVKEKLAFRKEVSKFKPGSSEYKNSVDSRIAKIFG